MCVAADAPWKTWQEFVDYAKKNPGVKYGHPGSGYCGVITGQKT